MKFPDLTEQKTILTYSKNLGITKKEVIKQKNEFEFVKAWKFKEHPKEYTLSFDPKLATKYYSKKIPTQWGY